MAKEIIKGNSKDWEISEWGEVTIEKCLLPANKQWNLVIPNNVDGKDIDSIASSAFCKHTYHMVGFEDAEEEYEPNEDIYELTVPEGIKTLGEKAFESCTKLKIVHLPESLLTIEDGCFKYCTELEQINIPSRVEKIGLECFVGCENISTVIIPSSVKDMEGAFKFCTIESVIISEGITAIKSFTFSSSVIGSIVIPRSITRIEKYALPDPNSNVTLYCYPGSYGLVFARQNGYQIENAAI